MLYTRAEAAQVLENAMNEAKAGAFNMDSDLSERLVKVTEGLRAGHCDISVEDALQTVYALISAMKATEYDAKKVDEVISVSFGIRIERAGFFAWGLIDDFDLHAIATRFAMNAYMGEPDRDDATVQYMTDKGFVFNDTDRKPTFPA